MSDPGKVEGLFHKDACTITIKHPSPTYVNICGPERAKINKILTKFNAIHVT